MCNSLSPDITLVCDAEVDAELSPFVGEGALNATTRGFVSETEVLSNRSSVDVSLTEGIGGDSAPDASGLLEIAGVEGSVGAEVEGGVGGGVGIGGGIGVGGDVGVGVGDGIEAGDGVGAGGGVGVGSDAIAELDTRVGSGLGVAVRVGEGSGAKSTTGFVGGLRSAGGSGRSYVTCIFEIVSSPGASLKKMSGTGN